MVSYYVLDDISHKGYVVRKDKDCEINDFDGWKPFDMIDYFFGGKEYTMTEVRVQKTCNLVKLQGVDTMDAAQAMRGKVIELYREDIDDEVIFADELIGVEVFAEGNCIGKITDVLDYPVNAVYVVKGEHEYMIPAVNQFILSTDVDANRMEVRLIEGMRSDEN
jgi:16S rRNA processing protein RimM